VLFADDHCLFSWALGRALEPVCAVAGIVTEGSEVPAAAGTSRADIIFLDLSMPGLSGAALLTAVRQAAPASAIVVLNATASSALAAECLKLGARAIITKRARPAALMTALEAVLAGRTHVELDPATSSTSERDRARDPRISRLTDRQRQVLELIGRGMQSQAIARTLGVSIRTVEAHRREAKRRLGAKTQADLYLIAIRYVDSLDGDPWARESHGESHARDAK
jgi:DNA-binding NarL/FixJ family response regulator